jgi:multiple antibiotic resistance protein
MEFALMSAGALFAIINPLAAIPTFFAMTPSNTEAERLRMARTASITATGVLILFALTGNRLFGIFGITIAAFQMAGGLVLLLVSLDSLRAKRSEVQETEEEKQEGIQKDDISITPLAIPMLSGPGAITTAVLLQSKTKTVLQDATLYLLFILMGFVCYFSFRFCIKKAKKINPIAMNITTRLMGLILAATAMQFMLDGVKKTFFAATFP